MAGLRIPFARRLLGGLHFAGEVLLLGGRTLRALARPRRAAPGFERAQWLRQCWFVGIESLPVVLTTGAFTGMVLAYSSYFQLERLSVTSWTGPLLAKSLVTQLGPVLAGLMLAGRVGCAMTAELGTMAVTEQVDALRTMGVDPVRHLVLPRTLACLFGAPLLTGFAMVVGIAAGFALAIYGLGAEPHFMIEQTKAWMVPWDYAMGLGKAAFFGLAIALICCLRGLQARGGAEGVGAATTGANVAACITILVSNLFLTMLLMQWE